MDDSEAADIRRSAQALYADGQAIWHKQDRWNSHKRAGIERFVTDKCMPILGGARTILNAGSGGEPYGWMPTHSINTDLFLEQVKRLSRGVVSDICRLPFADATFDLNICVGSVLNYVSLLEALAELSRSLKRRGHLIIHFESSNSFEQWFTPNWNKSVARITTINSGRVDKIWVYSPKFVVEVLASFGLQVRQRDSFHIASAMASRLGQKQDRAARFGNFDGWLKLFGAAGDDQIILAEKVS